MCLHLQEGPKLEEAIVEPTHRRIIIFGNRRRKSVEKEGNLEVPLTKMEEDNRHSLDLMWVAHLQDGFHSSAFLILNCVTPPHIK